jgi:uncharacterized SAM-binding protein YcdF (DUF218 family)
MRTWARRIAGTVVGAAVLWGTLAASLDRYGQRKSEGHYDAIVVAGCRVLPDGTPSLALQRRTEAAVALWRAGVAPRILFTGGVGDSPPSEALAASRYAETLGVPAQAMVLEDRSTSTAENARFAAETIGAHHRVVVVTDTYHVFRAERVFGRAFAEAEGVGSMARLDVRVRGALREVLAVGSYAVHGQL